MSPGRKKVNRPAVVIIEFHIVKPMPDIVSSSNV